MFRKVQRGGGTYSSLSYQDEVEKRRLVNLDKLCIPFFDLILACYRISLARIHVELSVLDDLNIARPNTNSIRSNNISQVNSPLPESFQKRLVRGRLQWPEDEIEMSLRSLQWDSFTLTVSSTMFMIVWMLNKI